MTESLDERAARRNASRKAAWGKGYLALGVVVFALAVALLFAGYWIPSTCASLIASALIALPTFDAEE